MTVMPYYAGLTAHRMTINSVERHVNALEGHMDAATQKSPQRIAASIPEIARQTGLGESLLYGLANLGKLPGCRRVGSKRFLVHIETFENWLRSGAGDGFSVEES